MEIFLEFEKGTFAKYPIEEERIEAEKQRLDKIINSEENGKNHFQLGSGVTLINTVKLLAYKII